MAGGDEVGDLELARGQRLDAALRAGGRAAELGAGAELAELAAGGVALALGAAGIELGFGLAQNLDRRLLSPASASARP